MAGSAVVFIHGIMGVPHQFAGIGKRLKNIDAILAPWLPGHGKDAWAFAKSSMQAWEDAAEQAVLGACTQYDRVYLVGHSMGGLLLASIAEKHPQVKGLVTIAMPLRFRYFPHALYNCLLVSLTKKECVAREMCGVPARPWIAVPFWLPRYLELFRKAGNVRKMLGHVRTPMHCFYFARDELCSPASVKLLPPGIRAEMLPQSRHSEWLEAEVCRIAQALQIMIDSANEKGETYHDL